MATPGIGDPYWYEWYVGLKNIIDMLNPDNGIEYVIFQCSKYDTIDDIVVGYKDGYHQICYQVKHEILTSKVQNLTFRKLIEREYESKPCLLSAIARGWQNARRSTNYQIKPILFTNRNLGTRRTSRVYNGKEYTAYSIQTFFETLTNKLTNISKEEVISFED